LDGGNHIANLETVQTVIKALYAAALCYGLISDVKSLKIPNEVPIALSALFFLNYWLAPGGSLWHHLLPGALGFLVTFIFYFAGVMGAGDVKLISALMLWAGTRDALAFLLLMSIIGGVFAGLLLIAGRLIALSVIADRFIPSRRFKNWAQRGIFPYGVAICAAGLILMPSFFAAPA